MATDFAQTTEQRLLAKRGSVSVLAAIPAFNEGATIGSVVLKAKQFADDVLVVDDGSSDDTASTATLAGAYVLRHARNLGKGMAIRTAWLFAREKRAEALVLLDADHQHDPKDIPRLVQPILEGNADIVIGVRWGKTSRMPIYRRAGKRVLDYATSAAVRNGALTDSQSGYRAFSLEAVIQLEPTETGLAIESQMLIDAQSRNLRIKELDIQARYDIDGSTLTPGRHGLTVLGRIIALVTERRPLFFFSIAGAALCAAAAALGIYILQIYYSTSPRLFAIGYALLFVVLAIVGIVSIFTGVVLNAVKQIASR